MRNSIVILVGWANQITSKSKEIKDIEVDFLKKVKLKRDTYKKIANEGGSTEDSLKALVDFLYTKKKDDLQIFENIKFIKIDIEKLDKKYSNRFWILLLMSICFFITGIVSFFLPSSQKFWAILPNLIFVLVVYVNLIKVHNCEKRYAKNISEAMEKL